MSGSALVSILGGAMLFVLACDGKTPVGAGSGGAPGLGGAAPAGAASGGTVGAASGGAPVVAAGGAAGGGGGTNGGGANGGGGGTNSGANGGGGGTNTGAAGGAAACTFAQTYTIVDGSGLDGLVRTILAPPATYLHENLFKTDPATGTFAACMPALPVCGSPSLIDVSDVEAAIANPDVQTALVTGPGYYGVNAPDAPVFSLKSEAHGNFSVSIVDCPAPAGTCVSAPPGVVALMQLVRALVTQQNADPSCAGVD